MKLSANELSTLILGCTFRIIGKDKLIDNENMSMEFKEEHINDIADLEELVSKLKKELESSERGNTDV